jgi:hypothetical protein
MFAVGLSAVSAQLILFGWWPILGQLKKAMPADNVTANIFDLTLWE